MICEICGGKEWEEFFDDWMNTHRLQCVNCGFIFEEDEEDISQ